MTRLSAPSSSRTLERICLAMKKATCSSSCQARRGGLGEQDGDAHLEFRRLERDGEPPAEARDEALLDPGDLLRIGVAGDDDLLVRFDEGVEKVEELLLRAVLAAEELYVVDQQEVERPVIALEVVKSLVLVRAHHIGDVGLGVDVTDLRGPVALQDVIAERLDQVGLAQSHAAVDEQRVVGRRVLGDLQRGRARELIRLARDEGGEGEGRVEARLLVPARQCGRGGHARGGLRRRRRREGGVGAATGGPAKATSVRAVRDGKGDGNRASFGLRGDFRDAAEETFLHPLQNKAVLREQPIASGDTFEGQRPDPGVELLGRQFLAESVEAVLPERGSADMRARGVRESRGGQPAGGEGECSQATGAQARRRNRSWPCATGSQKAPFARRGMLRPSFAAEV